MYNEVLLGITKQYKQPIFLKFFLSNETVAIFRYKKEILIICMNFENIM